MSSLTNPCLVNNPDISGIGFRISFYLQNFLLVWLSDRSRKEAPGALWTFIATSFGLIIAAIVQTKQHRLSFFQAVQVSNLVWLANFGIFLALATYSRRKTAKGMEHHKVRKSDNYAKYGATVQTLLSMSLTIYLWKNAGTFGNESKSCFASLKYVFFVFDVRVKGAGRIVALTLSSLLFGCYLVLTFTELLLNRSSRQRRATSRQQMKQKARQDEQPSIPRPVTARENSTFAASSSSSSASPAIGIDSANNLHHSQDKGDKAGKSNSTMSGSKSAAESSLAEKRSKRRHKRRWFDCDPMFLSVTLLQIVVFIYFVVSTELLLVRNPGQDNSSGQWGFGQILALIVILPSIISMLEAFDEVGIKHPQARKGTRRKDSKDLNNTHQRHILTADV